MFPRHERFRRIRFLGSGGAGDVYEALDLVRNARVAIKTLRDRGGQRSRRFKQEFRSLRAVTHPNLVGLGELFETDELLFFTMELVEGRNVLEYFGIATVPRANVERSPESVTVPSSALPHRDLGAIANTASDALTISEPRTWMDDAHRKPGVDNPELAAVFSQIVDGLMAIHAAGKVHRDIKPSNILVTATGRPIILDFGLALDLDPATQTSVDQVVGTVAYMAPEQAMPQPVTFAADWYSFGVMLFEVIVGALPVTGPALSVMLRKQQLVPPDPRLFVPSCPAALAQLCQMLLQPRPEDRPQAQDIAALLHGRTQPPRVVEVATHVATTSGVFVGRSRELSLLRSASAALDAPGPTVAVVRGDSGIGKSALVRNYTEIAKAEDRSTVALFGRCYEHEAVSFKGLDGVIDALARYLKTAPLHETAAFVPRDPGALTTVFPSLAAVDAIATAPSRTPPSDDPFQQRSRAFASLHDLLCRIAERVPLILVIDDMQWCDSDSLHLLSYLLAQPNTPPWLLLLTTRSSEPRFTSVFSCKVYELDLLPLSPRDSESLARRLMLHGSEAMVARIAAEAGGHPFYIAEMARYVLSTESASETTLHLDEVIRSRVRKLPTDTQSVLHLVVLAAAPLCEAAILRATGHHPQDELRHLTVLRAAHLIRGLGGAESSFVEPYHDRIRETINASLDDDDRALLNGRIAVALEDTMGAAVPEKVIYHLLQAGQIERAANQAREAGDRAKAGLAFARAIDFYRLALDHGRWSASERRAILLELGEVLVSAGRCPEAARTYEEASVGANAVTRLHCRIKVADQLVQSGRLERGLKLLMELFAERGHPAPRRQTSVALRMAWYRVTLWFRGLSWVPIDPSSARPTDLALLELYQAASRGLILIDPVRAAYFVARGLHLSLNLGVAHFVNYFLLMEGSFRWSEGPYGREVFVNRAVAYLEGGDDRWFTTIEQVHKGVRQYLTIDCNFAEAVETLTRNEAQIVRTANAAWELSASRFFIIYSLLKLGDLAQLRITSQRFIEEAQRRGNLYEQKTFRAMGSLLWLVDDHPAAAREALELDTWTPFADGYHMQHWAELNARVEIGLYEGSPIDPAFLHQNLRALRKSFITRVFGYRADTAVLIARIALANACPQVVQPRSARRVIARLSVMGTEYTKVWAWLLDGTLALKHGDDVRAEDKFNRVILAGGEAGFVLLVAVARYRLGRLLGDERGQILCELSEVWMRHAGVVDVARMCNVIAPIEEMVQSRKAHTHTHTGTHEFVRHRVSPHPVLEHRASDSPTP